MEPRKIENLLLQSISEPEDIATLRTKYGVSLPNFVFMPNEAKFIYDFIEEYSRVPEQSEVTAQFPTFIYEKKLPKLDYISNEFNKEIIRRETLITFSAHAKAEGPLEIDSRSGISNLIKQLEYIRDNYIYVDNSYRNVLDSDSVLERFENFKARLNGEERVESYELGIEPLERRLRMLPGNLIGIFADTAVGKSWLSLLLASELFMQQQRVVVVSPELSITELNARSDVILAYRMGLPLSYSAILTGEIPEGRDDIYDNYEKFAERIGKEGKWINYDSSENSELDLSAIEGIIIENDPKLLIIDGIYLMADRAQASWEKVKNLSTGLKVLATKYKTIIVVTNQAQRQAADSGQPSRKSEVADGYYYARSVDILISMGKIENETTIRSLKVLKVRSGEDINDDFVITFDVDRGDIGRNYNGSIGDSSSGMGNNTILGNELDYGSNYLFDDDGYGRRI